MSKLLSDKDRPLRCAQPGDDLSVVARAHTLAVLPRLAGSRKGSILRFLYESDLIGKYGQQSVIDLKRADLRGAFLSGADLSGINLSGADLRKANLFWTTLDGANLKGSNLSGHNLKITFLHSADLRGAILDNLVFLRAPSADLRGASLKSANLSRQDLSKKSSDAPKFLSAGDASGDDRSKERMYATFLTGANLRGTDLSGRDLTYAFLSGANLREANLTGVTGKTMEKLEQEAKSLKGATMNDGHTLKSTANPGGPTFEEWHKEAKKRRMHKAKAKKRHK
jgi:uncharacterized protein YjbI with pentapeptide repeats